MENKLLTISQYAEIKGISKQAVYKKLNTKLKEFIVVENGQKFLDIKVLELEEGLKVEQHLNQIEQPLNQQLNNEVVSLLEKMLEEKNQRIQELLEQNSALQQRNEKLIDTIQEQNNRLTELISQTHFLLATEKKNLLENGSGEKPKEKRKIFGIFKKKGNKTE